MHRGDAGGDPRLSGVWIEGEPRELRLVAALAYWPEDWDDVRRAQVFTGGIGPDGVAAKTMWAFLAPDLKGGQPHEDQGPQPRGHRHLRADELGDLLRGAARRAVLLLTIDLSEPGCWRLTLTTDDVEATVDIRAVD